MLKFLLGALALTTAVAMAGDLDVRNFGAKGDGETDDTAAFQRALDEAGKTGGRVNVPGGRYAIRGNLNIPEAVTLRGTFDAPARTIFNDNFLEKEKGSILLAFAGKGDEDGPPFIRLNRASHLSGVIVFYPEQTLDVVPYPWCVAGEGDNCTITATLLINPYKAVDFGSKPCGRHYINGLYAQALKTGLFIDKCFDVGRVENVHFWPFWRGDKELEEWHKKNTTAFIIARTDWQYMSNCFAIWSAVGFHFVANTDGGGNVLITNSGSDIGPIAVKVDNVQDHSGVSFVNCQLMATVETHPSNRGPVKFTACGFWNVPETAEHARLLGKGNVTFDNCHFTGWAASDKDAPCIRAEAGGVTIQASEFVDADKNKQHIMLGEGVESAIIVANRFRAPARIVNNSNGDVQIGLNTGGKAE